jgi:hypothetical protein
MSKHIHAELMLAYAQDAQESDTPWDQWEYKTKDEGPWRKCVVNPEWVVSVSYRKRIKTIRIGQYDVPEPLRVKPVIGTTYYYVSLKESNGVANYQWDNDEADNILLLNGAIHLTLDAAELHGKALMSLNAK